MKFKECKKMQKLKKFKKSLAMLLTFMLITGITGMSSKTKGTTQINAMPLPRLTIIYNSVGHTSGTIPVWHSTSAPGSLTLKNHNLKRPGYWSMGWIAPIFGLRQPGFVVNHTGATDQSWLLQVEWRLELWQYMFRGANLPTTITSGYGDRGDSVPAFPTHRGLDIAEPGIAGRAIHHVSSGEVIHVRNNEDAFGNYVVIDVDGYYVSGHKVRVAYAHLQSIFVSEGQHVTTSTAIGTVGGSGEGSLNMYEPHLHFEVITNGAVESLKNYSNSANPRNYFLSDEINFTGQNWWCRRVLTPNQAGGSVRCVHFPNNFCGVW